MLTLEEPMELEPTQPRPTFAEVIRDVAAKYNVTVQDLKGQRRYEPLSTARMELYVRCYVELPHLSVSAIARLIGGRDHTTVLKGAQKWCAKNGMAYPPKSR